MHSSRFMQLQCEKKCKLVLFWLRSNFVCTVGQGVSTPEYAFLGQSGIITIWVNGSPTMGAWKYVAGGRSDYILIFAKLLVVSTPRWGMCGVCCSAENGTSERRAAAEAA